MQADVATMLRFNRRQRTALGETLRQVGNLAAAALVLGQFVGDRSLSWRVLFAGTVAWMVFVAAGLFFLAGEE